MTLIYTCRSLDLVHGAQLHTGGTEPGVLCVVPESAAVAAELLSGNGACVSVLRSVC